jgi:hypothetical protein
MNKKIGFIICIMLLITSLSVSASIKETDFFQTNNLTNNYFNNEAVGIVLSIDQCIAPDNGSGTADLPAACPYESSEDPFYIINGLPPDTTIELDPVFDSFVSIVRTPGGPLGGEILEFDATLELVVTGTGDLAGFNRYLAVPVSFEINTAPRTPGDTVQTVISEIFQLDGELFGDPDFCMFRIKAGSDYGLPSPGQFILTKMPSGNFNIDSFFDITYQIEFEGCPGSVLDGFMGTTVDTTRLQQGIEFLNNPPNKPVISGNTHGKAGNVYEYTFITVDPDGDDIWYFTDWGDGTNTGWMGPFSSGTPHLQSNVWVEGNYTIRCKAKDLYNAESQWGILEIDMPRTKMLTFSFLMKILEQFPLLNKILSNTII